MVIKWVETLSPPPMIRSDYIRLRLEEKSREEIRESHFSGDPRIFREYLIEWELLSLETEREELRRMAQGKKTELLITKQGYLQRRLNGEKRSSILRSLGLAGPKGYELLKEWGIRELDAEERELELMAPVKAASEVDKRVAEQIEQKTEARGLVAFNEQKKAEPAETDMLERMEKRAAEPEQEMANLQAAVALWKNEAERKDEYIKDLEAELQKSRGEVERGNQRFTAVSEELGAEIARLKEALSGAAVISDQAGGRIKELEAERQLLLQTIERAAGEDAGIIAIRLPILSLAVANVERARIYEAVEALSDGVEAADIDRERVMTELFDLLQRTVNFITADLAELHPGRDVSGYVREFFAYYNDRHMELMLPADNRQAS